MCRILCHQVENKMRPPTMGGSPGVTPRVLGLGPGSAGGVSQSPAPLASPGSAGGHLGRDLRTQLKALADAEIPVRAGQMKLDRLLRMNSVCATSRLVSSQAASSHTRRSAGAQRLRARQLDPRRPAATALQPIGERGGAALERFLKRATQHSALRAAAAAHQRLDNHEAEVQPTDCALDGTQQRSGARGWLVAQWQCGSHGRARSRRSTPRRDLPGATSGASFAHACGIGGVSPDLPQRVPLGERDRALRLGWAPIVVIPPSPTRSCGVRRRVEQSDR